MGEGDPDRSTVPVLAGALRPSPLEWAIGATVGGSGTWLRVRARARRLPVRSGDQGEAACVPPKDGRGLYVGGGRAGGVAGGEEVRHELAAGLGAGVPQMRGE